MDDSSAKGTFTAARDVSAVGWVLAGMRDFDHTVGSIVPAGFEAYARVFHPASRGSRLRSSEVRWTEVAAANDRVMHPAAEWGSLTGSWDLPHGAGNPAVWDTPPLTGDLPGAVASRLAALLAQHTRTPQSCWFAVWIGRGPLDALLNTAPQFELPGRELWLLHGPVQAAATSPYPGPSGFAVNLWWPEDRAWCVGTDIDLMTTYVGGSDHCIEALLTEKTLEALAVSVDQRVTWDADTVNPLPAPP